MSLIRFSICVNCEFIWLLKSTHWKLALYGKKKIKITDATI